MTKQFHSRFNAFMEKEKLDSKIIVQYCNSAMDSSVENNMYVNKVWVQCENESCLKWRLLSSEDAAKVDHNEPWYCFMNTDSRYNKCSISEEDFPEESQLRQSGFKIVYSQLPLGSLVLVKLQNWPSWPGILCPDPFKGKYVTYDVDGNVEQYHIEFLGDPHSRSWINATFVEHYSITLKPGICKKKKKWYKSALQEAHVLYGSSHEQRLEMCHLSKKDKSKADGKVSVLAKKRMAATMFSPVLRAVLLPCYFPLKKWSLCHLPLNLGGPFCLPQPSIAEMTLSAGRSLLDVQSCSTSSREVVSYSPGPSGVKFRSHPNHLTVGKPRFKNFQVYPCHLYLSIFIGAPHRLPWGHYRNLLETCPAKDLLPAPERSSLGSGGAQLAPTPGHIAVNAWQRLLASPSTYPIDPLLPTFAPNSGALRDLRPRHPRGAPPLPGSSPRSGQRRGEWEDGDGC
uniref:Zinc finger CW-type and PWWP domain containing 2 n=1 Tax=Equus asinus TaxID=9793 RepID=A0A9L0IMX0_EQUAS